MKKQQQQFTIPQTIVEGKYQLERFIGRGSFGHVYKALEIDEERYVCLKITTNERVKTENGNQQIIYNEANILKGLNHPNIIKVYNFIEETNIQSVSGGTIPCSVLSIELCEEMNLQQAVEQNMLTQDQKSMICNQLIQAIIYLYEHCVMHCDIKPSNVLLDTQRNAKLADFGLSRMYQPGDVFLGNVGTPYSKAPEVYQGQYYDQKIDLWGLGVVLFYVDARELPFPQRSVTSLKTAVEKCDYPSERITNTDLRKTIARLLVRQADRADAEDLKLTQLLNVCFESRNEGPAPNQ